MDERLFDLLSKAGISSLLLTIIWAGIRQWWVFGWQFQAVVKERDEYKRLAFEGAGLAEEAVTKVVAKVRR